MLAYLCHRHSSSPTAPGMVHTCSCQVKVLQVKLSDVRTSSGNNRFWCQREAIDFDMKGLTTDSTIKICLMTVTCRAYLESRNWTALLLQELWQIRRCLYYCPSKLCAEGQSDSSIWALSYHPHPPFFSFFIKLFKKKKKKIKEGEEEWIFDPDTKKRSLDTSPESGDCQCSVTKFLLSCFTISQSLTSGINLCTVLKQ